MAPDAEEDRAAGLSSLPSWFVEDRWVPPPGSVAGRAVSRLMARHGIARFAELVERARDPEWFYPAAFDDLDLGWMAPFRRVAVAESPAAWRNWFPEGRTNVAWLAVTRWAKRAPERIALVCEAEDGTVEQVTYADLERRVDAAAAQLTGLGVAIGDVVGLLLPMVPDAAVALLALARIGAIALPMFSGYGPEAIAMRLESAGARVLVVADGYRRAGKVVGTLQAARSASSDTAGLVLAVVRRLGDELTADEVVFGQPSQQPPAAGTAAVSLPAGAPFLLGFTSGSSGRPKGVVHTHGGFPYRVAIDLGYGFDLRSQDRLTWITDMGWIMGPVCVLGPLCLGGTAVLIEGLPTYPNPARLWDIVERHQVAVLGLSPTLVRSLISAEALPGRELGCLRALGITGERCMPPVWRWLHRHVGFGRVPVINWSGGAEMGAGILIGSPVVETPECRFAGPCLGVSADVFDAEGHPAVGVAGELVIDRPVPSMTRGLWRDMDGYLRTYWSQWPGVWRHGDQAVRHADGTFELLGRSDEVMKVGGKRMDPAEFEAIAGAVPGVRACAAVPVPHDKLGEAPVIAVVPEEGQNHGQLRAAVAARVQANLGPAFRPAGVLIVAALPLSRSAKVLRRVARAWALGVDPGDVTNLANPEARDGFERWMPAPAPARPAARD